MERETPVAILREERDGQRHGKIGAEVVCGKRVLPVGFLSLSSCLGKTINEKGSSKEKQ